MPRLELEISEEQLEVLKAEVASGAFDTVEDAARAGIYLLQREREDYDYKLHVLRAEVQKGVDDIEAGRCVSFDTEDEFETYMNTLAEGAIARAEARRNAQAST